MAGDQPSHAHGDECRGVRGARGWSAPSCGHRYARGGLPGRVGGVAGSRDGGKCAGAAHCQRGAPPRWDGSSPRPAAKSLNRPGRPPEPRAPTSAAISRGRLVPTRASIRRSPVGSGDGPERRLDRSGQRLGSGDFHAFSCELEAFAERLGSDFGEDVEGQEAGKEHRAQQSGLGLFVGFDEQLLNHQVQQRGGAEC